MYCDFGLKIQPHIENLQFSFKYLLCMFRICILIFWLGKNFHKILVVNRRDKTVGRDLSNNDKIINKKVGLPMRKAIDLIYCQTLQREMKKTVLLCSEQYSTLLKLIKFHETNFRFFTFFSIDYHFHSACPVKHILQMVLCHTYCGPKLEYIHCLCLYLYTYFNIVFKRLFMTWPHSTDWIYFRFEYKNRLFKVWNIDMMKCTFRKSVDINESPIFIKIVIMLKLPAKLSVWPKYMIQFLTKSLKSHTKMSSKLPHKCLLSYYYYLCFDRSLS